MAILLFWAFLTVIVSRIAVPLFEGVVAIALASPLMALLMARLGWGAGLDLTTPQMQPILFGVSLFLVVLVSSSLYGLQKTRRSLGDLSALVVLAGVYVCAYYLCSAAWPDFNPLGERLRDYSLIVSAINSPVIANESWMEGTPLNYYVFWYRFAAMIHALTGMAVWNLYHGMVALAVALYAAVCFQIVRVVFAGGWFSALSAAVLIPFGSNIMGIVRMTRTEGGGWGPDGFWWGASRVVRGAITEFPAWSFILGDAHPHYLNLVTIPFLFLLFVRCVSSQGAALAVTAQACCLVVAGVLFLLGANAWDVPMWLGLCSVVAFLRLHESVGTAIRSLLRSRGFASWSLSLRGMSGVARSCVKQGAVKQAIAWMALFIALRLNSYHIVPEAGDLALVREPIAVTTTKELLYHWGAHIVVLVLGAISLLRLSFSNLAIVLLALSALLYDKAGAFVIVLLLFYVIRAVTSTGVSAPRTWMSVCTDALVISGIGLLMVPEVVFLNDAYGGENERMNTIFKIYTTAWGLLGLGSIAVSLRLWRSSAGLGLLARGAQRGVLVVVALMYCGGTFFFDTRARFGFYSNVIPKRWTSPSAEYGSEGLAQPNRDRPGSAAIIRLLRDLPHGRVLEAQGDPYSYTTFVATLSAQPSYLGWQNHLQLLSTERDEVARRAKVTEQFYGSMSCAERLALARQERIRYVVLGTNERLKYEDLPDEGFSCLTKLADYEEYALFEVR